MLHKAQARKALVIVDLAYGDAGKGTLTDYLTREQQAHTVIRFNGGAQAAHNVVTPGQQHHHTFAQFGSGMFSPGVQTYLSRFMLLEPYAMFNEEVHLRACGIRDAFARTTIDHRALITTPYHQAANRLRELARGAARHGSCGMGIGETVADHLKHGDAMLCAGEMPDQAQTRKKLRFLREAKWAELRAEYGAFLDSAAAKPHAEVFRDDDLIEIAAENYAHLAGQVQLADESALAALLDRPGTVIFEGAQGVLLDEDYGFAPYTTWSKTTFDNAAALLDEQNYSGHITRLGVLRTYFTRHGAGPFVTEAPSLNQQLPERHNTLTPWQQSFRRGYFDLVAARYAAAVAGQIDGLVLTHVDYLKHLPALQICTGYDFKGEVGELAGYFEHEGGRITGICVQRPADLAHQEALARLLFRCVPLYQTFADAQSYLAAIEAGLNTPIHITSQGATAAEKQRLERGQEIP